MENQPPKFDIEELAHKWQKGTLTAEEKQWYEEWYRSFDDSQTDAKISAAQDEIAARIYHNLQQRINRKIDKPVRKLINYRIWAAAASILLFLSVGGFFLVRRQAPPKIAQSIVQGPIMPGSNRAVLTLSNGKKLNLTDAKNGILLKQGSATVKKAGNGSLRYDGDNSPGTNGQSLTYNSVETPRGGQWSVTLSDGTKVWLDAASSIKYPVSFSGHERRVEITGQAYFEVVHNAAKPFRVVTNGQVIEDIGTKFNINAYDDEPSLKTTLLEGAVRVSYAKAASISEQMGIVLKPGQETSLRGNKLSVSDADLEAALAWKNERFIFHSTSLPIVMRELSRWYDVTVEYRGDLSDMKFNGEMFRSNSLSQVLKVLEFANVHFTVQGKKIIVTP